MTLQRSNFRAEMEDNQFQQLQLAIRLSACEGVQQIFQTYSTHKHTQVQSTAATIKSCLEAGDTDSMTTLMTSPMASPPVTGSAKQDRSASLWASIDSEMYRHH
ncbi:uncharacterized protein LOC127871869 [Dreissena polymorpha]|uniref:uncharacterized protein LOC127871869 n=1 Tax=Dreissena polymorpha TaxID=45954 RepID=UPI0022645E99|nr:uncharacterized protein LOC127871869 [Dreissena polymorpha]XP_052271094.1 uncharacterized protein LOC127871869 [Dreissena polymorpha]